MATSTPQRFGPEVLDQWFPLEEQRSYVTLWMGKVGLTPLGDNIERDDS
jgi:hypothetical protein